MSDITKYINNSKNICLYTTISIVLILIFIISPLNKYVFMSIIGKILILFILGFTLYGNIMNTGNILNSMNNNSNEMNNKINSNIICNYIFSFFILLLFLSVFKMFLV